MVINKYLISILVNTYEITTLPTICSRVKQLVHNTAKKRKSSFFVVPENVYEKRAYFNNASSALMYR